MADTTEKLTETMIAWRIRDKFDDIILFGMEEYCGEFDLDKLPNGWCGDCLADEVQKRMSKEKLWKENNYIFEYKFYKLHKDLMITT